MVDPNEDLPQADDDLQEKMKFFEDLNKIKAREKAIDVKASENMSKKDKKQMDKIMKEKDKLEMQAMVIRMQERDQKNKDKPHTVIDGTE